MALDLVFNDEAKREYVESYLWYEEKQEGLGERFIEKVEKCLDAIYQAPRRNPKKKGNYRESVVGVFPFVIVYEILEKQNIIHVAAIYHGKRNPQHKYRKKA